MLNTIIEYVAGPGKNVFDSAEEAIQLAADEDCTVVLNHNGRYHVVDKATKAQHINLQSLLSDEGWRTHTVWKGDRIIEAS